MFELMYLKSILMNCLLVDCVAWVEDALYKYNLNNRNKSIPSIESYARTNK